MIQLVLRSIRHQKSAALLFVIAFGLILTAMPLAFTSSKAMMAQVDADIGEKLV